MLSSLGRLWRGELPLVKAFWAWGVLGYLIVEAATAIVALVPVLAGMKGATPAVASVLPEFYVAGRIANTFIPSGYCVIAAVGVWRSAAGYDGPWYWPVLARLAVLAGLALVGLQMLVLLWGAVITMSAPGGR